MSCEHRGRDEEGACADFRAHREVCRIAAVNRRDFLTCSALALLDATRLRSWEPLRASAWQAADAQPASAEPIIDIHQHLGYSGRPDDVLLTHQRAMGATTTILLPAGRPVSTPSTHDGVSNGLQAQCLGNEACRQFARAHRQAFVFGANEVPDIEGATQEIERYLKLGGV